MEILGQFWWIIGTAVGMITLVILGTKAKVKQKAKQEAINQYKLDESTILNLYNRMSSNELRLYKDLPSREARLEWLTDNRPDFMEAVGRRYPESDYDFVVADNLDMRMLRDETVERRSAIRIYRNTAIAMSLNEYQQILDKKNAEFHKQAALRAKEKAQREAKAAAELARQQKAARKYWKSLTPVQKEAFKNARSETARKKALSGSSSSEYSRDTLYYTIMATQFNDITLSPNQSINSCESSTSGTTSGHSSGHTDSGSHGFDSGSVSSFDSGFSSSDGGCAAGGE